MAQLVATDKQIIEFIQAFCDDHGFSPSIREICKEFGYSSPSTIKVRIDYMRKIGLVTFIERVPRTIRVVRHDDSI